MSELTKELVGKMRVCFPIAIAEPPLTDVLALCDSHERLRERVAELKRERDEARKLAGALDGLRDKGEQEYHALTAQLAAAREALQEVVNTLGPNMKCTDLHERALKACEEHYRIHGDSSASGSGPCGEVSRIGRESLALKQPKPRWTVQDKPVLGTGCWGRRVMEGPHQRADFFGPNSEADARAYCAERNAAERGTT